MARGDYQWADIASFWLFVFLACTNGAVDQSLMLAVYDVPTIDPIDVWTTWSSTNYWLYWRIDHFGDTHACTRMHDTWIHTYTRICLYAARKIADSEHTCTHTCRHICMLAWVHVRLSDVAELFRPWLTSSRIVQKKVPHVQMETDTLSLSYTSARTHTFCARTRTTFWTTLGTHT